MADDPPKRKRGRPRGKAETGRIGFQLPMHHFRYLTYLVKKRKRLGKSVHDAARQILIQELDRMEQRGYPERDFEDG